jgi:hypothetical protein
MEFTLSEQLSITLGVVTEAIAGLLSDADKRPRMKASDITQLEIALRTFENKSDMVMSMADAIDCLKGYEGLGDLWFYLCESTGALTHTWGKVVYTWTPASRIELLVKGQDTINSFRFDHERLVKNEGCITY